MKYRYSITVGQRDENICGSTEAMFKRLKEFGYGAVDTSGGSYRDSYMEEREYCEKYKKLAKQYDIELFQGHAPILINRPESEFLSKEYKEKFIKRLERMARLGIRNVAAHGYVPEGIEFFRNDRTYDYTQLEAHNRELNLEFFAQFIPFLKQEGMILCLENLFAYDIILKHHVASVCADPVETNFYIDQLGEDCFAACYDTGHLNHFGADEYEFIKGLGKRLLITHCHDSWGKDFHGMDWHHLPGDGDVDWKKVAKGLDEIGYKGTINAEFKAREGAMYEVQMRYIADSLKALIEG